MKTLPFTLIMSICAINLAACVDYDHIYVTSHNPTVDKPNAHVEGSYNFSVDGQEETLATQGLLNGKGLTTLTIDGHYYPISFVANNVFKQDSESFSATSPDRFIYTGALDMRAGYVRLGKNLYTFAQGIPTTDMPTQGTVSYQGLSVYKYPNRWFSGRALFSVDFANKQVKGSLGGFNDEEGHYKRSALPFNATIKDNQFSATADNIKINGMFFGPQASSLGGTFHDTQKPLSGAFGAKRLTDTPNQ